MSVGSVPTFFSDGSMFMRLKCMRCKVKNNICINVLLEKKIPPICGKCKKNLIEQEDVDEICASIHPDELKPDPVPTDPFGLSDPGGGYDTDDLVNVDDEEENDWVI